MLKNIMMLFHNLKLIFQRLLWLVFVLLSGSMLVVYLLTLTILYLLFSVVIWPLDVMWHKELESVSTQVELEESTAEYEAEKYNILELYHFLKSLRQRLSAVLKTELEEVRLLFTSLFGTKR